MASEKVDQVLGTRDENGDLSNGSDNEKASYDDGVVGESFVTRDGVKVHPQPTADPLDPLNWSWIKKHSILAIVMYLYFMFTYITTTTVPSFPQLQDSLGISTSQVNWTVAIPALGLALGPLFWSSLSDIYGRRLIFLIGTFIAFVATIGAAVANKFSGYMAARFFQGFGVSPGATVGLAVVNDLFFDHERGQKMGMWVVAIDTGLLVGPIIGGAIDLVSAAWIQWLTLIMFGVLLVLEFCFMTETLYPRTHMLARMPIGTVDLSSSDLEKRNATDVSLPRTKKLSLFSYKPVPGLRHPKPWDTLLRFGLTFKHLIVVVAVGTYCFTWYWWVLSIITLIPVAYVQYSPQIQGALFIGLLLGTVFSEAFCSGRLSDSIVLKLTKKNNGVHIPEMRLWLAYPAATLSAIGLILWGVSIDKAYHWIVGQIAFFLFAAGIQMGNTVITSYIVDSYPLQSMSIITFYSVFLNLSAFADPFFISPWQTSSGFTWCFAAQGIITFFGAVPVVALLHWKGEDLRKVGGEMGWVNPEFDTL